jgi:predicted ester cyclase
MTDHKDLYRRYVHALVIKDGEAPDRALDQVLAADFIAHELPGGLVDGHSALKAFRRQVHVGFPDQTLTIEDLIAENDRVAARLTTVGTHRGEFRGIPATGRRITADVFDIVRVAEQGSQNGGPYSTEEGCSPSYNNAKPEPVMDNS